MLRGAPQANMFDAECQAKAPLTLYGSGRSSRQWGCSAPQLPQDVHYAEMDPFAKREGERCEEEEEQPLAEECSRLPTAPFPSPREEACWSCVGGPGAPALPWPSTRG